MHKLENIRFSVTDTLDDIDLFSILITKILRERYVHHIDFVIDKKKGICQRQIILRQIKYTYIQRTTFKKIQL